MIPFTPATLAAHWGCSDELVYGLIRSGKLEAWKLGGKLWRIKPEAVAEYEHRQAIGPGAPADAPPIGPAANASSVREGVSDIRTSARLSADQRPNPGESSMKATAR